MKTLFINILKAFRSSRFLIPLGLGSLLVWASWPLYSFQTENLAQPDVQVKGRTALELLEAGLATKKNVPSSLYYLSEGNYNKALQELDLATEGGYTWLRSYLENLVRVSKDLKKIESKHFDFYFPEDQMFMADYALPYLEGAAEKYAKVFGFRPKKRIRVEIYPVKEDFSHASTLDEETLKRSGAIAICKFHRLMILSPRALPMGYRWLDALAHEYMHLLINELSWSGAELWLHEGTARYFDTFYRSDPPDFLSPHQKTKLKTALEEEKLISFKRMSPSLVYLDSQEEVSLAFSQVSHAIGQLVERYKSKNFVKFLKLMRTKTFKEAFDVIYGMTPDIFEQTWITWLDGEPWEKTRGTISDEVRFTHLKEDDVIGIKVRGQIRLGDRMRQKKRFKAALIQYEKALEQEPENAVILLKVARTHLALNQKKEAVAKLRKAVQSNPNYGTPLLELAQLVKSKEALPYFLTANAINPFNPEIHAGLAKVYGDLGENKQAERELEILDLYFKNKKRSKGL